MKKLISILLIGWLPLFMAVANAMSMQMTLENEHAYQHSAAHIYCHQDMQHEQHSTPQHQPHQCTMCGFCTLVGSVAVSGYLPLLFTHAHILGNLSFLEVDFSSLQYPPAIKPPISA
jgi:hypothetical protein